MGLDFSRIRFDAHKDFLGVLMQQGRVQLDSDWNDLVAQLARRIQAGALDTLGAAAVPRETPDGFLIEAAGGKLTIGAGRMYVDGILVENHGALPRDQWNRRLAELSSTKAVDYTAQPYLPEPPALPTAGPHLVYLDVWQREVGHLQDESLIESAVGVDSTGRLQTVWQVKLLADVGNVNCATDDADVPNWPATIRPSGARLSTSTGSLPDPPNPCQVPPGAGYSGLENQLYRIEIHKPGPVGAATFKWSRDNATVATHVTNINNAGKQLTVQSVGNDDVLRFSDGDWIEVTDDWLELHNLPGELRRIKLGGGVDDETRTIDLEEPVTAFPTYAQNATDPQRHTVIRRWDQGGQVRKEDGTGYADLDAAGSAGEIPVPPAGTRVFLENGILVDFDLDPGDSEFRSGDYWVVAARTVDASVEELDRAAPLGIHHHYARLAMVTFPDDETDCRTLWPPLPQGESCDCTVCVSPEGHNSGTATIQQAIDSVKKVGGTVCLAAGKYLIRQPIKIEGARSLRVRGQGWATILQGSEAGPVVDISSGVGVALENLSVIGGGARAADGRIVVVAASNVVDFRMEHCNVLGVATRGATTAALGLSGVMLGAVVTDCALVGEEGIASGAGPEKHLLAAHLRVADNILLCGQRGVVFEGVCLHLGDSRVSDNMILGCADTALVVTGGTIPGSSLKVSGNVINTQGTGIRAGTDDLTLRDNEISGPIRERSGGDGIVLTRGLDPVAIDRLQIIGNRLLNVGGAGILIEHRVETGMIKQNTVENTGGAGLIVERGGSLGYVSIENNQFANLGSAENPDIAFAGLQIVAADRVDLVGNTIEGVGLRAVANPMVAGIAVGGVGELRVAANRVHAVGPDTSGRLVAGVYVAPPVRQIVLDDNTVRRSVTDEGEQPIVAWAAIIVFPVSARERIHPEIDPAALSIGSYKFVHGAESTFVLNPTHIFAVPRAPAELSVRGNRLAARETRVPLVLIGGGVGNCLFSENHCSVNGRPIAAPVHGSLAAFVNNVAHNRLIAEHDGDTLLLDNDRGHAVVLGNVTSGPILFVDGSSVPLPFDQLNLVGI